MTISSFRRFFPSLKRGESSHPISNDKTSAQLSAYISAHLACTLASISCSARSCLSVSVSLFVINRLYSRRCSDMYVYAEDQDRGESGSQSGGGAEEGGRKGKTTRRVLQGSEDERREVLRDQWSLRVWTSVWMDRMGTRSMMEQKQERKRKGREEKSDRKVELERVKHRPVSHRPERHHPPAEAQSTDRSTPRMEESE